MSTVVVREAWPDELAAAGEVVVRAYETVGMGPDDTYTNVVRDAPGRAAHCAVLVAVDPDDGSVLGSVTYVPDHRNPFTELAGETEGEFRMLGVAPEAHGRGVGEALVRACIARARADGRTAIAISTSPRMRAAQRLYERLGFRRAPERDWSPSPGIHLWAYVLDI